MSEHHLWSPVWDVVGYVVFGFVWLLIFAWRWIVPTLLLAPLVFLVLCMFEKAKEALGR
jgi:Na+/pantothenate symporter